jgi:hypothetical protein
MEMSWDGRWFADSTTLQATRFYTSLGATRPDAHTRIQRQDDSPNERTDARRFEQPMRPRAFSAWKHRQCVEFFRGRIRQGR